MQAVDYGQSLAVIGSGDASHLLVVTCEPDGSIPPNSRYLFTVANDNGDTLGNLEKLVKCWNENGRRKP